MKFDLIGKKAVVTGGSSGIGKAIVETLYAQGAKVFNIDLNEFPQNTETEVTTIITDITQEKELKASLENLPESIDILVNNAGIGFVGNIEDTEEEDFDRLYQVNVKGVFNCGEQSVCIYHDQRSCFGHDQRHSKRLPPPQSAL